MARSVRVPAPREGPHWGALSGVSKDYRYTTWVIVVEPLPPEAAWVAVMVQNPVLVEAVYVTARLPFALVTPTDGPTVPHAPGVPLSVNITGTPAIPAPVESRTVAVTVDVLIPSALIDDGFAVTATTMPCGTGLRVCVIVAAARPPDAASVAVIVQNPTVVEAV